MSASRAGASGRCVSPLPFAPHPPIGTSCKTLPGVADVDASLANSSFTAPPRIYPLPRPQKPTLPSPQRPHCLPWLARTTTLSSLPARTCPSRDEELSSVTPFPIVITSVNCPKGPVTKYCLDAVVLNREQSVSYGVYYVVQ